MAFWVAFKGVPIVEIIVRYPVPSFDLVRFQVSVSDVGGDAPDMEGAWAVWAPEFLSKVSKEQGHKR